MATINPYEIKDGGILTITNTKEPVSATDPTYHEAITYGADNKIETPDAGRITKFGPVKGDYPNQYIAIPEAYATIKLPLYRAGAGTTVDCLPKTYEDETLTAHPVIITPTLSEEVVYYMAACKALGLDITYTDGQ